MVSLDSDLTPEQAAAVHEGLAHPVRVATMRLLRGARRMPVADLRRVVSEGAEEVDWRTMRFHLRRMEKAGLVDVRLEAGHAVAVLLRDVALRLKTVHGA